MYIGFDIQTQQAEFIDDRNFPGGPEGYQGTHYAAAIWVIPSVAYVITEWLADGFLVSEYIVSMPSF